MRRVVAAGLAAVLFNGIIGSATAPAAPPPSEVPVPPVAAPATAPATEPYVRHAVVIPPGFHVISANGMNALCQPADDAWVKATLAAVTPTTRPTTTPSDLLANFDRVKPKLISTISADLALSDPKPIADYMDSKLGHYLHKLVELKVPAFFLISSQEQLKQLMKAGWSDPSLYYNQMTGEVHYNPNMVPTLDRDMDDVLVPCLSSEKEPPDKRKEIIVAAIRNWNHSVDEFIAAQGIGLSQRLLIQCIAENGIIPLKLKPGQQWWGMGVMACLSCKYQSMLSGQPSQILLHEQMDDNPSNPLKPASIDLLHQTDLKDIKPQFRAIYLDAFSRKATRAVNQWMEKAGDGAVPKMMTALRKSVPADGDAFVKLLKETTGVDVSPWLAPQE